MMKLAIFIIKDCSISVIKHKGGVELLADMKWFEALVRILHGMCGYFLISNLCVVHPV